MNLENYVNTLEQAKKLKELGIERESIFCWWKHAGSDEYHVRWYEYIMLPGYDRLPALTSQELGEIITRILSEHANVWGAKFINGKIDVFSPAAINFDGKLSDNEAQARAEFLIYLLESKKCPALANNHFSS